jgi:hypothetical protein
MWLPVVYDASGEARKKIACAASCGSPRRLQRNAFARGEFAGPGGPVLRLVLARLEAAAPLARLDQADQDAVHAHALKGANSVAMERTRLTTPARAAEVATMCGSGCAASSELTQTMAAPQCLRSCGRKARVGLNHGEELQVAVLRSRPRRLVSAKVETRPWPALLTRMEAAPSALRWRGKGAAPIRRRARRKAARTGGFGEALAQLRLARLAAVGIAAADGATAAPCCSSSSTVARPMPEEPPVTTAVRPASQIEGAKKEGAGALSVMACLYMVSLQRRRQRTTLARLARLVVEQAREFVGGRARAAPGLSMRLGLDVAGRSRWRPAPPRCGRLWSRTGAATVEMLDSKKPSPST